MIENGNLVSKESFKVKAPVKKEEPPVVQKMEKDLSGFSSRTKMTRAKLSPVPMNLDRINASLTKANS